MQPGAGPSSGAEPAAELLARAVDVASDGVVALRAVRDEDGAVVDFTALFANRAAREGLGLTPEDIGSRSFLELYPDGRSDGRWATLVEAVEHQVTTGADVQIPGRRRSRWIHFAAAPLDEDSIVVSFHDITELHESEARYRDLVEHQAELILRCNAEFELLYVNEAFARFFDRRPAELVGVNMLGLLSPDRSGRADVARANAALLSLENPTITTEEYVESSDGSRRWYQWTATAVATEGDRVTEIQVVGIDINDRKRAELATRAHLELLDVLNRINSRFIAMPVADVDAGIEAALGEIAAVTGVDRAAVFAIDDEEHVWITHEWCAAGVPPGPAWRYKVAAGLAPRYRDLLQRHEAVRIVDLEALGEGWEAEREHFGSSGARAILAVPMVEAGRRFGSIGVESTTGPRTWSDDEVAILTAAAAAIRQVLARRETELELHRSEDRYRALVAGVPDLLLRVDVGGKVLDWRAAPSAELEGVPGELVGRPLADYLPELAAAVEEAFDAAAAAELSEPTTIEVSAGDERSYEVRITVAGDEAIAVVRDVSDQQALQATLLHQANHDALTGLANRRLLSEHLDAALKHRRGNGSAPAILFADLDRFKVLNDSQGHEVGDAVLTEVARRLEAAVRPGDLVARLGGDEFAVLCHRIAQPVDAVRVGERVRTSIAAPIDAAGEEVVITASIGVVVATESSSTISMLRDADAAMYEAKAHGRNRLEVFTPLIHKAALARHRVEHELRRAIEADELELHYQPLWSVAEDRWSGVEALVRWRHPERGLLPPGEFLPVAEEAGLMASLGNWVKRRALRDARRWYEAGTDAVTVWVNVSAERLSSPGFAREVAALVASSGLPAGVLGVEVTETAVVVDLDTAVHNLSMLREAGIRVALDDFGTGLSSLTHLDRLPLDVVKLDGSFITGADRTGRSQELVESIVNLVHRLDLEVVAEMVETPAQVLALRELGVDVLQGYHLGRPVPYEDLLVALAEPFEMPSAESLG